MDKSYNLFDTFISTHNVRQVYYVPYPTTRRDKCGWCVAIKMKPRGYIESDHVQDDVPYQVEEMSHVNKLARSTSSTPPLKSCNLEILSTLMTLLTCDISSTW